MTIEPTSETPAGIADGANPLAEVNPDLEKLRAYTQAKLALAEQLRIVREALAALGRNRGEGQCEELLVKLAEDRFTLAMLGQFKRGKSSLMNAIIGRELLPTGVLPLTSAITVLKYGPAERLAVNREDSIFPDELPVSALAGYVTEKGNPANRLKVKTACVELPVPFLRRGVEFVDTPGVGSAITSNTLTTYEFLPECDAALFVTSVDTPMTSVELAFLKEIRQYMDRIFFVVNKTDLVTDNERDEILKFIAEAVREQTGLNPIKIFPVSARLGLAAKTEGDAVLYEQSGLKVLEEALASFLSGEKTAAFLGAVAHKALQILDEETTQGTFGKAALEARASTIQKEKSATLPRDPYTAAAAVKEARKKLAALHAGILQGRMTEAEIPEVPPSSTAQTDPAVVTAQDAPMPAAANIAADLQTRGCPVCQYITGQAAKFFAHWQYRLSTEEQAQAEFAAELGFCPFHTWQLLAVSSPHGASVGYARLADEAARRLKEIIAAPAAKDGMRRLLHDSRSCRVCGLLQRAEEDYIRRLARFISETAGRNGYRHSEGVCLRHLGMLLSTVTAAETREFLLTHAAQRFEEDAEDMRSYALKHEAVRRALQNCNEKDAYRRAVIRIAGGRNVYLPWEEDGKI
ncbi:Hypothetical protein LUCI_5062 [Lucifera butyrica]|uniref:Dynamin N-terminal domain-containing protein n=1 Tax=Lucifera butyrica TaxID=1351585 RepID=A0A498RE37_9FIRM|nr:DUF6062 family protein [Lucifera butyrica]VBB09764.1 Hypothetical protein LUCI_5062 [Lucifera butyrica]